MNSKLDTDSRICKIKFKTSSKILAIVRLIYCVPYKYSMFSPKSANIYK